MRDTREVKAAAAGALVIGIYTLLVLSTGLISMENFARLLDFYLKASFLLWLFLGILTILVELYRNRPVNGPGPGPFAVIISIGNARWERDRFASLFWPPLLFAILMTSFNAFKQMILSAAGFGYDPLFAQLDWIIFFGNDPWRLTHAVFRSPDATWLIDRAYEGWFVALSLGVLVSAWLPGSTYRLRNQYLLSYIAIWIGMGSFLAFLLPAAGPCYYEHFFGPNPHFTGLTGALATAQSAAGSELMALSNQALLLRTFGGDSLAVGAGISAMPSVHNGLAVLFAVAGFRVNKVLGWVLTSYALLIWIGSIHLGWHYAIDGVAAAAATGAIWIGAGRLLDRFEPHPVIGEPEAAIA